MFLLRLLITPRSAVRSAEWDSRAHWWRLALYVLLTGGVVAWAFSDNRVLAEETRPLLSTFKGIVMRAHRESWDWLTPAYAWLNVGQGEAMRLWDTLLTTGFLLYTMFASLLALAVVARLRMWRFNIAWEYSFGTALYGWVCLVPLTSLSLVPLMEVLICRHCGLRVALFIVLNLAGWAYLGFYTLGDLGERPAGWFPHLMKSLGYGLAQYVLAYIVFLILIACIIPL